MSTATSKHSTCYVCEYDRGTTVLEPVNYLVGPKEFRLYRWLKFHAKKGIRLHGVGQSVAGSPAQGKNLLSLTVAWDMRSHHTEMKNARNRFCDIAHTNPDLGFDLWRLDFDYKGGLYFTDNAQVMTDLGLTYRHHRSTVNIREMQMAGVMQGATSTHYTTFVALLEEQAKGDWNYDRFLVQSGLALRDHIVSDGGYPTWDRARIGIEVDRLGIDNVPARYEVHRLLCAEAGCP